MLFQSIPYGLVVRSLGFHQDGPGSIPGMHLGALSYVIPIKLRYQNIIREFLQDVPVV